VLIRTVKLVRIFDLRALYMLFGMHEDSEYREFIRGLIAVVPV
jgi:hypothetical protein